MAVKTVSVAPGVELDIEEFTKDEQGVFDRDFDKLVAHYTKFSVKADGKHVIMDLFNENKDVFALIGQAAKKSIQPSAGVFQGLRAMTGFGMRMIRPQDLVPTAQGGVGTPTFDAVTAGAINTWQGLYHNGVIGAAGGWNATPLYLRKELAVGIVGMMELDPSPKIEEVQFEVNGKPLPVFNMLTQMRGTDMQIFRFPVVEYLKPAVQYRSQAKFSVALGGTTCPVPLGITFVISDWMRQATPPAGNQPSTAAP